MFERLPSSSSGGQREQGKQNQEGELMLVNDIVTRRLEIADNQLWIDQHQKKSVQLKKRMEDLDSRISKINESEQKMESLIDGFKEKKLPGVKFLETTLENIRREITDLSNKRSRIQSELEASDKKIESHTKERDRIADELIKYYEGRFKLIEAELEKLKTRENELNLLAAVVEAEYEEQSIKLNDTEKGKTEVEEVLRGMGRSENKIRKHGTIKELEGLLKEGKEKVRIKKEGLVQREAEIRRDNARIEAKKKLYKNRQEEFRLMKKGSQDVSPESEKTFAGAEPEMKSQDQRGVEDKERLSISDFLTKWNAFMEERYKKAVKPIDEKDFFEKTDLNKNRKLRMSSKNFKNILGKYLIFKGLPIEQFNESIDTFLSEIEKK